MTTTDLSAFSSNQLKELELTLNQMRTVGLPSDFYDEDVVPMLNLSSGNVFLTNGEYQVAMLNSGKLESFYSCPQCGNEGFWDEFRDIHNHSGESDKDCQEFIKTYEENRK